jgi:hypothetical protein
MELITAFWYGYIMGAIVGIGIAILLHEIGANRRRRRNERNDR